MSHDDEPPARRRFLMQGLAAAAGVLAGEHARANEGAPPGIPEWTKAPGADVGSQTYGLPSRLERGVIRNVPKGLTQYTSASSRTPLQDLDGILTSDDDVYAVSGYVLHLNGLVPEGAVLDAATLAAVRIPNRDGFVPDPRPDVKP